MFFRPGALSGSGPFSSHDMRFPKPAAFLLLGVSIAVVGLTVRPPPPPTHQHDFRPLLLRPAFAQTVSKPFLPLLVDLLWMRSLNAIGLRDSAEKNRALHEYGVVITDLDPRFKQVYEFIGLNIPFATGRNTFVGGDLACDIFERGLKQFPQDRKLHMYLGFSLFHHQRKYIEASEVFVRASKLPDALPWMALLATRLKSHAGSAEDAVAFTREVLSSELEPEERAELEGRLAELEVEVVLQRVDRALDAYKARFGTPARTIDELRVALLYDGPGLDPQGGLISIGADARATSTSLNRRLDIYE